MYELTGMLVELHAALPSYFNLAPIIDFVKENALGMTDLNLSTQTEKRILL